jgi:type VI secretion system protein ImpC
VAETFQFDFRMNGAARRREHTTVRLLLMGDFGARAHRGLADVGSLARRPVVAVDVDSLDAVVGRCAPRIHATLDDGSAVDLGFACIDDFHADHLAAAHPPLAELMTMRARLLDPAQFTAAAAELGAVSSNSPRVSEGEDDRSAVRRLLGDAPTRTAPRSAAANTVAQFIRGATAGKDSAPDLTFQPQYLAAVEALVTARLRALLHLPAFQSLEAAWRGVQLLVSRIDFGDELELHLLDVSLDELRADTAQAAGDPSRSALARRLQKLADEAVDADATWSLATGLFSFGAVDLDVLAAVGAAAGAAGFPFVAGADTTLAGTFPDASEWQAPDAATLTRWQALRAGETASAIGLVAPRMLLRLPYGSASEPIDSYGFEELVAAAPSPGELLWGEGSLAALLVLARDDDTNPLDIDDLPALTFAADGERKLQPCAEWLIGERIADRLVDHGLMPLLGSRHRNAVRLAGWRTIASV